MLRYVHKIVYNIHWSCVLKSPSVGYLFTGRVLVFGFHSLVQQFFHLGDASDTARKSGRTNEVLPSYCKGLD